MIDFHYQAEKWIKPRRVVCKIEWHVGELFPRVGFIVTNSSLEADRVITVYNGRAKIENWIKEGKYTLRWDKTSCNRFSCTFESGIVLGKLYDVGDFAGVMQVFQAKVGPQHRV